MGVLTPVGKSFREVRRHLVTVSLVTVGAAALVLVNQLLGLLAILVATPMLIDLTVGKRKSAKSAFMSSKGRIGRYLLWRLAVTVVGLAVVGTSLALVLFTFYRQWQSLGGASLLDSSASFDVGWALASMALLTLAAVVGLVVGVVGDLLAVAAAAGYDSPWRAVGAVFSRSNRWMNTASLAVVYGMVFVSLAVNGVVFGLFTVKAGLLEPLLVAYPQVVDVLSGLAARLPELWVMWSVMVVSAIVTSFVSSIMRPVMLAQVMADSAGQPTETPAETAEAPV